MNMKKATLSCLFALTTMMATSAWADEVTFRPLQSETLPDMTTPRRSHVCFATAEGDIIAVGGHTKNFRLTSTAERLHNGEWESVSISNPHDGPAITTLPDGRVLICGGFSSGSGVGQSTVCDIYDPTTNTFTATGSLNTSRAFATAVLTGVGNNVLVSGNWYNSDTTFELWNGETWTAFGSKTPQLNHPFMINDGQGNVYAFGCRETHGNLVEVAAWKVNTIDQTVETLTETGLEDYELMHGENFSFQTSDGKLLLLGKKDDAVHLLSFSAATAKVTELTTLPDAIPDVTDHFDYSPGILVNEDRKEAYIIGGFGNSEGKTLVLVNYNLETGKTTVFYDQPLGYCLYWGAWTLQPGTGKIVITGGSVTNNFDIVAASVIVTPYEEEEDEVTFSPLQSEALPDMTTPRRSHVCFATAEGDIIAVGGHTKNFRLTSTAERLHNGEWESVSISNPHDGPAITTLPDGRVLICGGFSSGSGVGQSTVCDIYDPTTNTFTATGSLNTSRAFATAVLTGVGNNVLVSGNWYNSDTTFELWNGETWTAFGSKTPQLNHPFMINDGQGNVYAFGCRETHGNLVEVAAWKVNTIDQTVETLTETGLEDYELMHGENFSFQTSDGKLLLLGKKDDAVHLLSFSAATAKVTELTTLPDAIPDVTDHFDYSPGILVNEDRKEAYIIGGFGNSEGKTLVLVNYNLETGKTTVFYDQPLGYCLYWGAWTLQPSTGKIVITGGSVTNNFDIVAASVIVTPYEGDDPSAIVTTKQLAPADGHCYTLGGQRVNHPVRSGIYIRNGKKVVIK